jgi:SsrA-binding protein
MGHDPVRPRKLLLHRKEITDLIVQTTQKGFTLIPLRVYIKDSLAKLEIAVARGKKLYDKRESIAERETRRRLDRVVKARSIKGR